VASCQPNQDGYCLDKALANDAIIRASRVAPAIVDGRILWVDDKPQNNERIKNILERMGIQVVLKNSTQDALNALKIAPYDVVITNVWRPNDPDHLKNELTVCRVHYFDFPRGLDTKKYFSDEEQAKDAEQARQLALDHFNVDANKKSASGYDLANTIITLWGNEDQTPPIIFYTAEHDCGYRITNRGDVLLNSIVSILEQRHANRLAKKPWEDKGSVKD